MKYTKQQITEAIGYWKNQLRTLNEEWNDKVAANLKNILVDNKDNKRYFRKLLDNVEKMAKRSIGMQSDEALNINVGIKQKVGNGEHSQTGLFISIATSRTPAPASDGDVKSNEKLSDLDISKILDFVNGALDELRCVPPKFRFKLSKEDIVKRMEEQKGETVKNNKLSDDGMDWDEDLNYLTFFANL